MDFEEMVQKIVNAKAKASLRSSTMIWELDVRCLKGHRPSHNTFSKVQIQETTAKEPHTTKFRPKKVKQANGKALTPPRFECTESGKTFCTDKKKEYFEKKMKK